MREGSVTNSEKVPGEDDEAGAVLWLNRRIHIRISGLTPQLAKPHVRALCVHVRVGALLGGLEGRPPLRLHRAPNAHDWRHRGSTRVGGV